MSIKTVPNLYERGSHLRWEQNSMKYLITQKLRWQVDLTFFSRYPFPRKNQNLRNFPVEGIWSVSFSISSQRAPPTQTYCRLSIGWTEEPLFLFQPHLYSNCSHQWSPLFCNQFFSPRALLGIQHWDQLSWFQQLPYRESQFSGKNRFLLKPWRHDLFFRHFEVIEVFSCEYFCRIKLFCTIKIP